MVWVRRVLSFLGVAAAVLIVAPMIGSSTTEVGPGEVTIGFHPASSGSTTLAVPPIGKAGAPTHRGPVEVRLELKSLDVARLVGTDGRVDAGALKASIDDDLRGAAAGIVLRFCAVGLVVGAVAAGLLPNRRLLSVALGAVEGLVVSALLVASAVPGFEDSRCFKSDPFVARPAPIGAMSVFLEHDLVDGNPKPGCGECTDDDDCLDAPNLECRDRLCVEIPSP